MTVFVCGTISATGTAFLVDTPLLSPRSDPSATGQRLPDASSSTWSGPWAHSAVEPFRRQKRGL